MPSSTTPARCQRASSWRRRSSVSGTPMWLLRLPSVAKRAVAEPGAQDRRDHLRHRGLAVAAGHRDQRQVEARAPGARPAAAGACSVSATCRPGSPASARPRCGQRRHGALRARPAPRKSWRIEALALAARRTGRRRCSVRVSLCTRSNAHGAVADQRASRAAARGPAQRHHGACPPRARARAPASATSENGCRTPAISW